MAKQCLFCPLPVDSAEHIWSDWILQDLKPTQPIHIRIGKTTAKWVDNPEVKINRVCHRCNSTWMSDLESQTQPQIRAMMHGDSIVLSAAQQRSLTRWAVLKSMVIDGSSAKRTPFYSQDERNALKSPSSFIPTGTRTWIGRLSLKAFHAGLTDTFGEIDRIPEAFHGCVTTIIVGHLVVQVITMHVLPMFATFHLRPQYKPGAWDVSLVEIWPVFGEARWPPPFSFVLEGTTHHIRGVINRWKIGTDIG